MRGNEVAKGPAELASRREDAERRLMRMAQRDPLVAATVRCVAANSGVPAAELLRRDRHAAIAAARQLAMYLVNVKLEYTMTRVGALFGRDRTTVAHACMAVEDRRDEPAFDEAVSRLEAEIDRFTQAEPAEELRHAAG
ncbi:MAG TPA: helix-turn-helix domain-containing protein [Devosia sp.]|nr:helix-turn-helix domain-containing protein [Devosia sp.]